ncbi:DsbA family protein [Methylobrevis pamukkalensis]|nr:DsbA family protein [Methylobrevis pamukkalensis]
MKTLAALFVALALAAAPVLPAAAQQATGGGLTREAVLRDPAAPVLGNPDGDVTIVEYVDYQCGYCKKMRPELMKVVNDDGKVRLVMKEWPIFGPVSEHAARMALAAAFQGGYARAHESLMEHKGKLSEAVVEKVLQGAGLDLARLRADLERHGKEIDAHLARNGQQGDASAFRVRRRWWSRASCFRA